MAYQLPPETSTKRKFNDYAAASTARMRHNEILFNSSSLMSDLNLVIHDLCNCNNNTDINANVTRMMKMLTDFLANTPKDGADGSEEYLQIFIHSYVLAALVKLYVSPSIIKKQAAHGCVCQFIDNCKILFTDPTTIYRKFAPIFFEFCVHHVFCDLLEKSKLCLKELESQLSLVNIERGEPIIGCWSQYLLILKELESISKLYKGLNEMFWEKMRQRRVPLCFLIGKLSKMSTYYQWILEHKEVTHFKIRQCFALKMLLEERHKNEELYEMLICRSRLFEDSFEYIGHASPRSLRGQLFIQFENEEATGPGVLREWFSLVCEVIFNPQNALFVSCPNDGRRFFPNPALHLDYFVFSGRIIALALLHRVQISIAFDRVLFLQLAGEDISFEDIRDWLQEDTEDILGLTFVCDGKELGSRKVVELCPNGKNMIVNSQNRDNYVNLLVKHRFVTSIARFSDIIIDRRLRESFYRILDHENEDLNRMLHGSTTTISVEDWEEHLQWLQKK
ncbi:hypothetical protein H5410_045159 [Solanum commersonii]|uniref:HECT-type E3 ubiquitin transferase n=1 Tax=Solanum commersonii TaxID=4109 RepID=A0A9J5XAW5_SOLCO|nr:hypothetical protein H5410_045159 [Solanum commersonii]